MKVTNVTPFCGETVCFEGETNEFVRYGSNCWMERFGESEEPCYSNELELEAAYQEWKKSLGKS